MPIFGVSTTDGTLSVCKAKPENRGRGRCPHSEHHELEGPMAAPAVIQAYNEEQLASTFGSISTMKKLQPTNPAVPSPGGGVGMSRREFSEASYELAGAFPQEDWDYINEFCHEFESRLEDEEYQSHFSSAQESVQAYLMSDSPVASRIRDFLGPEIDMDTFSTILVREVRSMRAQLPLINSKNRQSLSRIIGTNLNNDMTRERYVASVLFFGGRCCYCNCVLTKDEAETKATGEHITPLSSESGSPIVGGTRYGNMALACWGCNNERGNKDLGVWLKETKRFPLEEKKAAIRRIQSFREFALYREYTPQQSELIRKTTSELVSLFRSKPATQKAYEAETWSFLKREFQGRLYELERDLRS